MRQRPITTDELNATLSDSRHFGWGYATKRNLNTRDQHNLDVVVATIATEPHWNASQLFKWSNSKNGRWLVDSIAGVAHTQSAMRPIAERHVTLRGLS